MKSLGSLLKSIFKTKTIDESAFEDIEDALIEGDVGASAAVAIVDELRAVAKKEKGKLSSALIISFPSMSKVSTMLINFTSTKSRVIVLTSNVATRLSHFSSLFALG